MFHRPAAGSPIRGYHNAHRRTQVRIGRRCGANGLVASFNRPGGNVTGMTILAADLTSRRLQLLTEMVPGLERVAVLTNPSDPNQASQIKQAQTAAQSLTV